MIKKFICILLTLITMSFCLFGICGCSQTIEFTVEDVELYEGAGKMINYNLKPLGTMAQITYEIVSQSVEDNVRINGHKLYADVAGTAVIKATAVNFPEDDKTFKLETEFNCTVNPVPAETDGNLIKNAGFEYGWAGYSLTILPEDSDYAYSVSSQGSTHNGDGAVKLWYNTDNEAEDSFALDITFGQKVQAQSGDYLFSLWYCGDATTITMTAEVGEERYQSQFSGIGYIVKTGQNGYVNYGINVPVPSDCEVELSVRVEGPEGVYGYVDDLSFKTGSTDDLVVAPPPPYLGETNLLTNGDFSASTTGWSVVETAGNGTNDSGCRVSKGYFTCWDKITPLVLRLEQDVTLEQGIYSLFVEYVGENVVFDNCYIYVEQNGVIIYRSELTPIGWNNGVFAPSQIDNMELSGAVTVGIYITRAEVDNNWLNFDNFFLWESGD